MTNVVLAAGYATRLYPLTENFPKPLLKVGDITILDRLLSDIDSLPEIEAHVIISNHKFLEHFEQWMAGQHYQKPVTLLDDGSMSNETRLGAVKDLQLAVTTLGLNGDLLVIAGDNVLDFSFAPFLRFAQEKGTSCVMCHAENELAKLQKTAVIARDDEGLITSYEEKPREPKGNLAVPPFYIYKQADAARIGEAILDGCPIDAPGSFAAWVSKKTPMHAWLMSGRRYDIGDMESYERAQQLFV